MTGNVLRLRLAAMALAVLGVLSTRTAWAGCANQCEVTAEEPLVEPPVPSCVSVDYTVGECNCSADFKVYNGCETEIVAKDFTFEGCRGAGTGTYAPECSVLEPHFTGTIGETLETVGVTEHTFTIESTDGEHRVTVRANVSEFVDSGCSLATRARVPGSSSLGYASVLAAALLLTRSRRRSASRRA